MRLIDADKLYPNCVSNKGGLAISQSQIANAETVEQRTTAEWIRNENFPFSEFPFKCSKCGYKVEYNTNFCPFCGSIIKDTIMTKQ